MNNEEIKIGETYYIRVKADSKDSESVYCQLIDADVKGRKALSFYNWMLYSFIPVPPAPKYDPCRLYKKGDKVKLRKWCGRNPVIYGMNLFQLDEVLNVDEAENPKEEGLILVSNAACKQSIHACYLELVTPVEEREPYYVKETASVYEVFNRNENNSSVAIFFKSQYSIEKAKERAEAERDRLNAEYRKEQNNG